MKPDAIRARAKAATVRPCPSQACPFPADCVHATTAVLTETGALGPVWLVLPYPPALNTLYGHRVVYVKGKPTAVPYKTHAHRDYCDAAGRLAVAPWPKDVRLAVTLRLYRPRRIGDIDGPLKTLFDALNGRAWVDDSQIHELHVVKLHDKARPRVEVTVAALNDVAQEGM